MTPERGRTAEGLEDLRLRLYRRDPPADAVAVYLEALRRSGSDIPAAPPPPPPPPRRTLRRTALGILAGAATLAGLVALPLVTRQLPEAAASLPTPTATAATARYPTVPGVELGVLSGGRATAEAFDAEGHVAIVSVICSGDGTITLRLGHADPAVLTCQAGGPALAMLESPGPVDRFTLAVAPSRGVRWSLAVGAVPAG